MHQKQFYVGVDWASQSHHVCVLKADGDRLGEQVFKHTGEGLARMAGWILKLAQSEPELVQVAIEVPHGPVVESLLNRSSLEPGGHGRATSGGDRARQARARCENLDLGSDLANNWMLALWAVVPTPDRARIVRGGLQLPGAPRLQHQAQFRAREQGPGQPARDAEPVRLCATRLALLVWCGPEVQVHRRTTSGRPPPSQ